MVRKGLQFLLQTDPSIEVVGEACDGREAVRLTEQLSPDVVVMDITMPQLNGIDAASQIVKRDPNIGVIMLSMHVRDLSRPCPGGRRPRLSSQRLRRSRSVAGRPFGRQQKAILQPIHHPNTTGRLHAPDAKRGPGRFLRSTHRREKEVLQLLAEGKSNKEAASLLTVSLYTIETHRSRLMQKLNLHSTADIVLYAVRKRIIQ